jgi:hypothetical protein
MRNIKIPQSNSNDTEVFIAEWKFKDNDLIKKGDHLFSIETSKVVEEIFAEYSGYLKIQSGEGSRVQVGETVGFITEKKTDTKIENKSNEKKTIFTKKAKELLSKNNIDLKVFQRNNIVNEDMVKKYLVNFNKKKSKFSNQLIILQKENKPYHACVYFESYGLIDLSLLGSRTHKIKDYNFGDCTCQFFKLDYANVDKAVQFFSQPALLTDKIIKKEKNSRGWSQKAESADYILKFRNIRSKELDDMNCIEWLIRGLEINGTNIPNNILTASSLLKWALENLIVINKEENLNEFNHLYK